MNNTMDGPGTLDDLNSAGDQKNWFEQSAGRGSEWVKAHQDLNDATSPPEVTVATIQGRLQLLQAIASPGHQLMNNGLGFLISLALTPLIELIELGVGDPEQMRATGEGWEQVAVWLDGVSEQEVARSEATADLWKGEDGDAFREQMTEFGGGVAALAADIRDLKANLDLIADLFDMFVEFAIQLLVEFVIGLIVQWLAALAASWITAGGSVAAAQAGTVAQTAATGGRIAQALMKVQRALAKIMMQLEKFMRRLRGPLKKVIERMNKLRGGNALQRFAARRIDGASGLGRLVTRADAAGVSTTVNRFATSATGSQALATNMSQTVLTSILGGSTRWSQAAFRAGLEVGTDAAIEQGVNYAYDEGSDVAQNQTEEERRDAQEKGFSL